MKALYTLLWKMPFGESYILFNHLSGCCCVWKAVFPPSYLEAAAEVEDLTILMNHCLEMTAPFEATTERTDAEF